MSVEAPEATFTCPRCGAEYTGGDACPSCGLLQAQVPCDDDPSRSAAYRCVLCGRTVCGSDPAGNRAALCDQHAHVPIIEGWAQVYTTGDRLEADLIVQNLQAEGIDAQVYSQKDDHAFPVDLGELSIVRVLAPVWEFGDAMDLVASYTSSDGEVAFACPNCGEVYEAGATQCAHCGASLIGGEDAPRAAGNHTPTGGAPEASASPGDHTPTGGSPSAPRSGGDSVPLGGAPPASSALGGPAPMGGAAPLPLGDADPALEFRDPAAPLGDDDRTRMGGTPPAPLPDGNHTPTGGAPGAPSGDDDATLVR